jgi:hypothetical protein
MFVKLEIPPDCKVMVMGPEGAQELKGEITIWPRFSRPASSPIVAYGESFLENQPGDSSVDQFCLEVSGRTGRVTKRSQNKDVIPLVEQGGNKHAPKS